MQILGFSEEMIHPSKFEKLDDNGACRGRDWFEGGRREIEGVEVGQIRSKRVIERVEELFIFIFFYFKAYIRYMGIFVQKIYF